RIEVKLRKDPHRRLPLDALTVAPAFLILHSSKNSFNSRVGIVTLRKGREMNAHMIPDLRCAMSREAIIGHDTAWKISQSGVAQYRHGYEAELLGAIEEAALKLKASHAVHKHLDLTFITGADRFIPEIRELINDKLRLERLSDMMGTKLEPYPLSIVGSTV